MNWVRINDDQHQYGTTNSAITGDPRIFGRVYVGTNGYGIVYGDTTVTPQEPEEPGQDAVISPTAATYDRNPDKQADIAVKLTLNGNTLTGIYNGSTPLTEGEDYTISGSQVTILRGFLAEQPIGYDAPDLPLPAPGPMRCSASRL